ncbi:MAG: ComEA family DNA-binding protein [Deltaproteobacteria bacterium]|nr:ComEA family DNA-binding protein [Deltaproteobacteria bacterium]
MTREQQSIVLFLSLLLSLLFFLTSPPSPVSEAVRANPERNFPSKKSAEGEILVEVDGSVNHRGIYSIGAGMNVLDVLEKAGGISEKLSLPAENLLQKVEKNCRLSILPIGEGRGRVLLEPLAPQKQKVLSVPININTASVEELDTLPGIGPKMARAIFEYRETYGKFASPEDLLLVPGIGPKKLSALLPHITVGEKP